MIQNGNVGIGTTNPAQKLHLEDAGAQLPIIRLSGTGNVSGAQIGRASNVFSGSTAYDLGINVATGQDIWFGDGSTANMVIKESGNVGIGTTSPSAGLQINTSNPTLRTNGSVFIGGNVGIGTTVPGQVLSVAGTFNATQSGGSIILNSNGDIVVNLG